MRSFLLCLLLIASAVASTSYAGSFDKCQQKEKNATGLRTCIEAERNRAASRLRDQNTATLHIVEKIARDVHDKELVKQFRAQQAYHVRSRNGTCRKHRSKNEKVACEADMDYAHADKLKRYTKK